MSPRSGDLLQSDHIDKLPPDIREILQKAVHGITEPLDEYRESSLDALKALFTDKYASLRKVQVDPNKFVNSLLAPIEVAIRWRQAHPLETPAQHSAQQEGRSSVGGAGEVHTRQALAREPEPARWLVPTVQKNSQGARQLRQVQGAKKLGMTASNTQLALQTALSGAERCQEQHHGRRDCTFCRRQVAADLPQYESGITICKQCSETQYKLLDLHDVTHQRAKVQRLQAAPLRQAPGAGASGRGAPGRPFPQSLPGRAFYSARGVDEGINLQAPLISGHDMQDQQAANDWGRQRQQQEPGKRSVSDAANHDAEPGARRTAAGATKQLGRRSATIEPADKEPIDLADTSEEEQAADAGDEPRTKTGNAAGPGPSSAAAAAVTTEKATGSRNGKFGRLSVRLAGLKCWFPSVGGKHSVEVTAEDLARLDHGEYLNDTCIDFYIKYIECNLKEDIRQRYHFFNSFFLKKLMEKATKGIKMAKSERLRRDHERVKKWTKHVDVFAKDFIFVPIHDSLHWSLVLICHPGNVGYQLDDVRLPTSADEAGEQQMGAGTPLMLHLDSMDGNHAPKPIFEALRGYLELEWKRKADDETQESMPRKWKERFVTAGRSVPEVRFTVATLPGLSMAARLPKQDNHSDCGLFLLTYMDFFAAANPRCVVNEGSNAQDVHVLDPLPAAANAVTLLQKTWFQKGNAARLRDHMRALICKLMLERISQEDARHSTLVCVVEDYHNKSEELGQRYLPPEKYMAYVQSRPKDSKLILDDVIFSSGSDGQDHMEDAKDVLQSPSRHLTRAAARQAGVQPMKGLTSGSNSKRRKGAAVSDAGPSYRSGDGRKPMVDLSSPDKVPRTPQVRDTQQAQDAAEVLHGGDCLHEGPQPMDIDDEDEGVEVLGSPLEPKEAPDVGRLEPKPGGANRVGREGSGEPASTRGRPRKLSSREPAARLNEHAEDLCDSTGDDNPKGPDAPSASAGKQVNDEDDDDEPPRRQRFAPQRRSRCLQRIQREVAPAAPLSDANDADVEGIDAEAVPSSQADPEMLPGEVSGCKPKSSSGKPRRRTEKVAEAHKFKARAEVKSLDEATLASTVVVSSVGRSGHSQAPAVISACAATVQHILPVQETGNGFELPEDGFVPGDDADGDRVDPPWVKEQAAKNVASSPGGYIMSSSDSDTLPGPATKAHRQPHRGSQRRQQQQTLPHEMPESGGPATEAALAGAATYRTHVRFPDDGGKPVTERVCILSNEAGEKAPLSTCTTQPPLFPIVSYSSSSMGSDDGTNMQSRPRPCGAQCPAVQDAQRAAVGQRALKAAVGAIGAAPAACTDVVADGSTETRGTISLASGKAPHVELQSDGGLLLSDELPTTTTTTGRIAAVAAQGRRNGGQACLAGQPGMPTRSSQQHLVNPSAPVVASPSAMMAQPPLLQCVGTIGRNPAGIPPPCLGRTMLARRSTACVATDPAARASAAVAPVSCIAGAVLQTTAPSLVAGRSPRVADLERPEDEWDDDSTANLEYQPTSSPILGAQGQGYEPESALTNSHSMYGLSGGDCRANQAPPAHSAEDDQRCSDYQHTYHKHLIPLHKGLYRKLNNGRFGLGDSVAAALPSAENDQAAPLLKGLSKSSEVPLDSYSFLPRSIDQYGIGPETGREWPPAELSLLRDAQAPAESPSQQVGAGPNAPGGPLEQSEDISVVQRLQAQQREGKSVVAAVAGRSSSNKLKAQVVIARRELALKPVGGYRAVVGVPKYIPSAASAGKDRASQCPAVEPADIVTLASLPQFPNGAAGDAPLFKAALPSCPEDEHDTVLGATRKRRHVEMERSAPDLVAIIEGQETSSGQEHHLTTGAYMCRSTSHPPQSEGITCDHRKSRTAVITYPFNEQQPPLQGESPDEHPPLRLELGHGDGRGSHDSLQQSPHRQVSDGGMLSTEDEIESPSPCGRSSLVTHGASLPTWPARDGVTAAAAHSPVALMENRRTETALRTGQEPPTSSCATHLLPTGCSQVAAPKATPENPPRKVALAAAADSAMPSSHFVDKQVLPCIDEQPSVRREPIAVDVAYRHTEAGVSGDQGTALRPCVAASPATAGAEGWARHITQADGAADSLINLQLTDTKRAVVGGPVTSLSHAACAVVRGFQQTAVAAANLVWPSSIIARDRAIAATATASAGLGTASAAASDMMLDSSESCGHMEVCVIDVAEDEEEAEGKLDKNNSTATGRAGDPGCGGGSGSAQRQSNKLTTRGTLQGAGSPPEPAGGGVENKVVAIDDIDQEDSVDLVEPADEDIAADDSGDFVEGTNPDLGGRSAGAGAKACGGATSSGRRKVASSERQRRGDKVSSRKGRGKPSSSKFTKGRGKPSSSTKGVTPSHGSGGAVAGRNSKQQQQQPQRKSVGGGKLSGAGIGLYCTLSSKPDFPRLTKEEQAPDGAYDLTEN